MKQIRVHEYDDWVMTITDKEYKQLCDGNKDITELLEDRRNTNKLVWRNGGTDWE